MRHLLLTTAFLSLIAPAWAQDQTLMIIEPHAFETVGSVTAGGVFVTIENHGDTEEVLLSANTNRAKTTELHTIIDENGVKKMRPVEKMTIPAHGTLKLERGSDHIMLMGVTSPLKAGESVPLTLNFQNAGARDIEAKVIPQGAKTDAHDHHAHH